VVTVLPFAAVRVVLPAGVGRPAEPELRTSDRAALGAVGFAPWLTPPVFAVVLPTPLGLLVVGPREPLLGLLVVGPWEPPLVALVPPGLLVVAPWLVPVAEVPWLVPPAVEPRAAPLVPAGWLADVAAGLAGVAAGLAGVDFLLSSARAIEHPRITRTTARQLAVLIERANELYKAISSSRSSRDLLEPTGRGSY